MMSEYTTTPCHCNTRTLQCWYQQQISEERGEYVNVTNNGQRKVEQVQTQ